MAKIDQTEVKQLVHELSVCKGRLIQINLMVDASKTGEITIPEDTACYLFRQTQELSDKSNELMGYLRLLFQGAE